MEVGFVQNVLRPGDPGYAYDKEVEFKPNQTNEWDVSDTFDDFWSFILVNGIDIKNYFI